MIQTVVSSFVKAFLVHTIPKCFLGEILGFIGGWSFVLFLAAADRTLFLVCLREKNRSNGNCSCDDPARVGNL